MEQSILELVKNIRVSNVRQKGSFTTDDGAVRYYVIESEESTLRFWNSSNFQSPTNISYLIDDIRTKILDGEQSGNAHDGWNEIMWEII